MQVDKRAVISASVIVALIGFVGGYFSGRSGQTVITKDRIVEKVVTVDTSKKSDTNARTEDRQVLADVDRTVIHHPDGTVEEHTVDHSKTSAKTVEVRTVVQERVVVQEHVRVETHEKLVLRRPDWGVALSGGISVPGLLGRPTYTVLPLGISRSAVFGLSVERRVFGDTYFGVHANSQGVVGLQARVTF